MATSIEWTDETWNPVRGCALVSPGCTNCYAMKQAHRFSGAGKPYEGLTRMRAKGGPVWTGAARFVPEMLSTPLHWHEPRRVFVNSMSDLFHEDIADEEIAAVYGVMSRARNHTFQVLTKRADRLPKFYAYMDSLAAEASARWVARVAEAERACGEEVGRRGAHKDAGQALAAHEAMKRALTPFNWRGKSGAVGAMHVDWPPPNVWIGVSVEDRKHGLPRLDELRKVPAAVRMVSFEPLLEDLGEINLDGIGWAIVGGESGPGARPFDLRWARSIVAQCRAAGVPVFVKQMGANSRIDSGPRIATNDRKGGDMLEWPADLRVREWPKVSRE